MEAITQIGSNGQVKEQSPRCEGKNVFVSFDFAIGGAARPKRRVQHDRSNPVVKGAMYWAIS